MYLQFSKGDEEIADLFWDIGLKRNSARVLVLMIRDFDVTSREIERFVDLRQPEVSIALNDLLKKRWIDIIGQITENKGRPVKIYHISRSLDEILEELKESIEGEYDKKVEEIEQVRGMLKKENK
jgi:predicted transcriptional regulator